MALVDELAHTNIEGSKHRKRYEDVLELLDAGIDVLSTMNIQHLESVTPTVQGVTGIVVRETVPDWVLQRVNEVVMIDLTPEALQNRMRRGDVYPQERVGRALENFFRETNLIALRELALRQVAQQVDLSLEQHRGAEEEDRAAVAIRERIAVCISSNPAAQYLIARGARMAQAMNAELFVVYIDLGQDGSEENQRTLAANLRFAENVGASIVRLKGKTVARGGRGICQRETHHAGGFWPLRDAGLEAIFLSVGDSPVFARRPGGGRAHCDAGTGMIRNAKPRNARV